MRKIFVIGIGAGNPDHLTFQAAAAMAQVDVFFVIDKGEATQDLADLRTELLRRHATVKPHRVVAIADPARDRDPVDYSAAVVAWHNERARRIGAAIAEELGADSVGAFLVWGDPSLYDSTLRVLDQVLGAGHVGFDHEVIAGISSVQALAASHRVPLHGIGEPTLITTGRRLAEDLALGVPNTVVMLDGQTAYNQIDNADLDNADLEIFWGAYLGTPQEVLVAGPLRDVAAEITRKRAEGRARHGWIMDIYLLRRRRSRNDQI